MPPQVPRRDPREEPPESERFHTPLSGQVGIFEVLYSIKAEVGTVHKRIDEMQHTMTRIGEESSVNGSKLTDLSEKLLEPDEGLFARVRDIERKIELTEKITEKKGDETEAAVKQVDKLVTWKDTWGKVGWYVLIALVGVVLKYIFDFLVTKPK